MVRALFLEYPDDAGSWSVEDQYLFGSDLLVAPLLEGGTTARPVYLPPGDWIDYQTGKSSSAGWHTIAAGEIPVVLLVRDGAAIPHIALAPSTSKMDWGSIELVVFAERAQAAEGIVYLPSGEAVQRVSLVRRGGRFVLAEDPLGGAVEWRLRAYGNGRREGAR